MNLEFSLFYSFFPYNILKTYIYKKNIIYFKNQNSINII